MKKQPPTRPARATRTAPRAPKKLALRRESVTQLEGQSLRPAAGAAPCFTYRCHSGQTCLCSSG